MTTGTSTRDDDIFDSDAMIAGAGRLTELLADWNTVVRGELGHRQSYDGYNLAARREQRWHQLLVFTAAGAGTVAVLMAILQLALDLASDKSTHVQSRLSPVVSLLAVSEYFTAALALLTVLIGLMVAFHYRWRLLRFKAEQYRFLKFSFLLHAQKWLDMPQPRRLEELRTQLAALHALDNNDNRDWAQGISSLVPPDPPLDPNPDPQLVADLVRYFRVKRLADQRDYFERRGHDLHAVERRLGWISPACFFLSILFALFHLGGEVYHHARFGGHADPASANHAGEEWVKLAIIFCLLFAVAAPVVGAGIRTYRTAFEFGRNSHRFAGLALLLAQIDRDLDHTDAPLIKLLLLYRAESALIAENRSWSHLMLEAEWFG